MLLTVRYILTALHTLNPITILHPLTIQQHTETLAFERKNQSSPLLLSPSLFNPIDLHALHRFRNKKRRRIITHGSRPDVTMFPLPHFPRSAQTFQMQSIDASRCIRENRERKNRPNHVCWTLQSIQSNTFPTPPAGHTESQWRGVVLLPPTSQFLWPKN